MKVVSNEGLTVIYPFVKPDSDVVGFREHMIIFPDGTAKLFWDNKVRLDAQAARALAEALLHAVEISQNGQKGRE